MLRGNDESDWDSEYIAEYIDSKGYLNHGHFSEKAIEPCDKPLPEKPEFLKILSGHYSGK